MKCRILSEIDGRMRVRLFMPRMSLKQADIVEEYLGAVAGVKSVKVFDRNCDVVVEYSDRAAVVSALSGFSFETCGITEPKPTGRELNREYQDKLAGVVMRRVLKKALLPAPWRAAICAAKCSQYFARGVKSLWHKRLDVAVLDATAITVSVLRGDTDTASSIMFMLKIGDILEEWTHKKSVDDLARTMSLNVDKVWVKSGDTEELKSISDVNVGDDIIVRMGSMIPLDGKLVSGSAAVNQSSMTGESMPVRKEVGSYVYGGTVVEEGECVIKVEKSLGSGRYDRIVHMIEDSEKLKSDTESQAYHLADRLVPYSLGATALTWLITRNPTKALAILMVDFSCALKLSMPIAVLSAMRESGADIITFGGHEQNEMLCLAACLEEHYPHSIANAVVNEAIRRGLNHDERHSKVEYVVAHGIHSTVDGQKVILGSHHFVFEDEGCTVPDDERDKFASLPTQYSHLYLAISGSLAAVICIADPLRSEVRGVMDSLRALGLDKLVMMTGDSERTAAAVAKYAGVDEYYAEVLPEDKAAFIRAEHEKGRKVIMIGDGVNDSPALSEADAGIAMSDGAAIAREIADVTICSDDLESLVTLKRISDGLMQRIHANYRFIISFNTGLIVLGVAGVLPPSTSALLHNISTLAIGLRSMRNLLP
ncbi:MAG: HAD-IC family P-type ATPase [Firmicutes bacterium]|nr:HAD-IC family P-type ATPase [Bacillota bacterium]